jgi:hypothetical protein
VVDDRRTLPAMFPTPIKRKPMRLPVACAVLLAAIAPVTVPVAHAANLPPAMARSSDVVTDIGAKRQRPVRDCTPTNGPFGFYGNIWCQPPNEASYLRNLGASWPMNTPPSLKKSKPDSTTDW